MFMTKIHYSFLVEIKVIFTKGLWPRFVFVYIYHKHVQYSEYTFTFKARVIRVKNPSKSQKRYLA